MKAVFMIGEQRSGSNLLRLLLNESPAIAAPHPPHILQRFMPIVSAYEHLEDESTFTTLIDLVCRLVELNPVQWEGVSLDRAKLRSRCRTKSLVAIYGAIMDEFAEAQNAQMWLCKSLQNIRWAEDLEQYFEQPKYIYLYRDPRDVALSFTKAVIGEKHPYFIATQWAQLQQLCLDHQRNVPSDRFYSLSYEQLIRDPDKILPNLCQFLGIEFDEKMLAFHLSSEANRTADASSLWGNLTQPIMKANTEKYLKDLSKKDISIVESITGRIMDQLGYKRKYIKFGQEMEFSQWQIEQFSVENTQRKNAKLTATDPQDILRRKAQEKIIEDAYAKAS